ncbi:metalloregulator ArsR/SmtB family transcription factor [Nocardioides sp. Bht2]|uniref:metalloregulator ArsR/SmtB family transcription factor n=1 Tax=Nocardioides sp. Bht2 TaxID=3392297 RepID=UPI0039B4F882
MHEQLSALADGSRWRIVGLLAERPLAVGAVAELCDLRQPQATKHLQTLERAGVVVSRRSGTRRIYALEVDALRLLAAEFGRLLEVAAANAENRTRFDQYIAAVDSETRRADHDQWADGREYRLRRTLPADRATTWRHLVEPALLARWWTTRDLRVSRLEFGTTPGDSVVQEYVDVDARHPTGEPIGRATGHIDKVTPGRRITFRLSPLLPDGSPAFTAHYEWELSDAADGTVFDVLLHISESTTAAAEFVAGISLGWEQSLDNLAELLTTTSDPDSTQELR